MSTENNIIQIIKHDHEPLTDVAIANLRLFLQEVEDFKIAFGPETLEAVAHLQTEQRTADPKLSQITAYRVQKKRKGREGGETLC